MSQQEWEVQYILQKGRKDDLTHYLVKWKGYSQKEATWEPITNLANCYQQIVLYQKKSEQASLKEKKKKQAQNKKSLNFSNIFETRQKQKSLKRQNTIKIHDDNNVQSRITKRKRRKLNIQDQDIIEMEKKINEVHELINQQSLKSNFMEEKSIVINVEKQNVIQKQTDFVILKQIKPLMINKNIQKKQKQALKIQNNCNKSKQIDLIIINNENLQICQILEQQKIQEDRYKICEIIFQNYLKQKFKNIIKRSKSQFNIQIINCQNNSFNFLEQNNIKETQKISKIQQIHFLMRLSYNWILINRQKDQLTFLDIKNLSLQLWSVFKEKALNRKQN